MTIPPWVIVTVLVLVGAYILAPDSEYGAQVENTARAAHEAACD